MSATGPALGQTFHRAAFEHALLKIPAIERLAKTRSCHGSSAKEPVNSHRAVFDPACWYHAADQLG